MSKHGQFNRETNILDVEFVGNGDTLRLKEVLWFRDHTTGKFWFGLPGQESDGASIPKSLWGWVGHPLYGPFRRAAILHDTYYRRRPAGISRRDIDLMFYHALLTDSVGLVRANILYGAVRACGWYVWRGSKGGTSVDQ